MTQLISTRKILESQLQHQLNLAKHKRASARTGTGSPFISKAFTAVAPTFVCLVHKHGLTTKLGETPRDITAEMIKKINHLRSFPFCLDNSKSGRFVAVLLHGTVTHARRRSLLSGPGRHCRPLTRLIRTFVTARRS